MLRLGQKVMIIADQFEQNLPIGQHAYIIAYDRNADNAFDYVIRIPKSSRHCYVPAADIELEETVLRQEAEKIEREALIDYALATKNQELFRRIMNGELEASEETIVKEVQSTQDFIKQVNLKAWI